jgi:hypothetical protein
MRARLQITPIRWKKHDRIKIAWGALLPLVEARLSIFQAIHDGHLAG